MRNVLLKIQYDGTSFHGWQKQPEARTVQGELEKVLMKLCGSEITLEGTSRTDAGVHAMGQQACVKGDFTIPADRIKLAANNMLAGGMNKLKVGDVKIVEAKDMDPEFHARFDAKGKTYIYRIYNSSEVDIFRRNYCYQVMDTLNIEDMKKAAAFIEGTHDFKCFESAGGTPRTTTVRTVYDITIRQEGASIAIYVTGDGFLYNMVRIITGTLVDAGRGKIKPEGIPDIIESRDRRNAGHTAPPQGLYLSRIYYAEEELKEAVRKQFAEL